MKLYRDGETCVAAREQVALMEAAGWSRKPSGQAQEAAGGQEEKDAGDQPNPPPAAPRRRR